MKKIRNLVTVLLVCWLVFSMTPVVSATEDQGGSTTLTANVPAIVTYDANGGSGTMETDSVAVGGELTLPPCGFTAPGGKQFQCWEIGSETHAPGEKITVDSHITVKAVWEDAPGGGIGNNPQTGDNSHLLLWAVLLMTSGIGVVCLLISKKRRMI